VDLGGRAVFAGDRPYSRSADRDPAAAQSDPAVLGAVPVGGPVRVVLALRAARSVTSAAINSPITSKPMPTDAAKRPSRLWAANASSCSLTFPARRSCSFGSDRSTKPIPDTRRRLPAPDLLVGDCFLHWWSSVPNSVERDAPSVPHGTAEAEDRHINFYDARVNL
jgi:hypothetical protein